jgi:O-antigen/teichoic acid export membrane protein
MELSKHLGKGIWGLADKALPVVYGVGFVVLVIRVLPEEEFGNFILVQEIFLIITGLAAGFALQPLLKFAAESKVENHGIVNAGLYWNGAFTILSALLLVLIREPLSGILKSPNLAPLMLYLPAMLVASFVRNFTLVLLQTQFRIKEIFWTDAAHFLGAPLIVWIVSKMHLFDTALDLIIINIASLFISSVLGIWLSRSMINLKVKPTAPELRKLWDYGVYTLGGNVSFLFYTKSDSFILSAFSGPVQVAVYNSVKVFIRVYDMVTQIVQMFVLPAVSRLSAKGETNSLKSLIEKAITFSIVGMIPIFLLFLLFSPLLIHLVYAGRYVEAIPMLQLFAVLSFAVPLIAIGSNTLLGLGHARLNFVVSVEMLFVSTIAFLVFIPLYGAMGATLGYVVASVILAALNMYYLNRFIPFTMRELWKRTHDITAFAKRSLMRN